MNSFLLFGLISKLIFASSGSLSLITSYMLDASVFSKISIIDYNTNESLISHYFDIIPICMFLSKN